MYLKGDDVVSIYDSKSNPIIVLILFLIKHVVASCKYASLFVFFIFFSFNLNNEMLVSLSLSYSRGPVES